MDSEARGLFQGSRCLPDKQCKCSAKGLVFHNTAKLCQLLGTGRGNF